MKVFRNWLFNKKIRNFDDYIQWNRGYMALMGAKFTKDNKYLWTVFKSIKRKGFINKKWKKEFPIDLLYWKNNGGN